MVEEGIGVTCMRAWNSGRGRSHAPKKKRTNKIRGAECAILSSEKGVTAGATGVQRIAKQRYERKQGRNIVQRWGLSLRYAMAGSLAGSWLGSTLEVFQSSARALR